MDWCGEALDYLVNIVSCDGQGVKVRACADDWKRLETA